MLYIGITLIILETLKVSAYANRMPRSTLSVPAMTSSASQKVYQAGLLVLQTGNRITNILNTSETTRKVRQSLVNKKISFKFQSALIIQLQVTITIQSSDELLALKLLRENPHPNVLGFNSYYIDNMHCYIAMDYLSHGTLLDLQKRYNFKIPMSIIQEVMQQILEGLNHLHQLKIIHRDIKYDNIMIASFNPLQIKIIDLGLSAINNTSNSRAGTVGYMAPEVFSSSRVTEKQTFSVPELYSTNYLLVDRSMRIIGKIKQLTLESVLTFRIKMPKIYCIKCQVQTLNQDTMLKTALVTLSSLMKPTNCLRKLNCFYLSPKQAKLQVHTPATDFVSNQNVNPFRLN